MRLMESYVKRKKFCFYVKKNKPFVLFDRFNINTGSKINLCYLFRNKVPKIFLKPYKFWAKVCPT